MRPTMPFLALAMALCGCSGKASENAAPVPSGSAVPVVSAAPSAVASAAAPAALARSVEESNALYEFEFSYPAAAAAIPALKAALDKALEDERGGLAANAKDMRAEAKKEGFPFNPLGSWTAWSVVASLPDWLSLSAEVSSYEGGAHPNHGYDALLWDRKADKRRAALDLFTSKAALSGAIRQDFCRLLDRERAKKRGAPVKRGSDEPFSDCIDPVESTVILGSAGGKAFDRIGVLIGPYEAGPYVEGGYEVTLPVTAAVLAAVKPEYRASFAPAR
ncbi:MAG: DUF3298 and DUF4163 domain-containing protein [Novosphingobium sp.]|nr:DUF3298 and DUF4163 domain-containing protein [Novosphingobium sp.]